MTLENLREALDKQVRGMIRLLRAPLRAGAGGENGKPPEERVSEANSAIRLTEGFLEHIERIAQELRSAFDETMIGRDRLVEAIQKRVTPATS